MRCARLLRICVASFPAAQDQGRTVGSFKIRSLPFLMAGACLLAWLPDACMPSRLPACLPLWLGVAGSRRWHGMTVRAGRPRWGG